MRRSLGVILISVVALALAGCALRGSAKTTRNQPPVPAPPKGGTVAATPQPLSVPQTQVQLPPAQPVAPEALAAIEEPARVVETPEPPPARPQRRVGGTGVTSTPRTEPPAAPPVVQAPPATPQRPPVQEAISPEEQKRLNESIGARRREVTQNVDTATARGLSAAGRPVVNRIRSFVKLADEALVGGDLRQADALMERAQILSRELQSAR